MEVYVPAAAANTWRGTYYVRSTIVKSVSGVYTMTLKDGSRKTFAADGRITGIINPEGGMLTVNYTGTAPNLRVSAVSGSSGASSVLYAYEYTGAGRLYRITQSINGAEVRRTEYTYWSSGLLQQVQTQEKRGAVWLEIETSFFTYHAGNTGLLHYVLGDEALRRMESVGLNPATASDAEIAPYADTCYTYDSSSRMRTVATMGGGYEWTMDYESSGFSANLPNEWNSKTTVVRRKGGSATVYSTETVYFNRAGSVLLTKVEALNATGTGTEVWYPVCQQFDEKARIVMDVSAAAIESVDEGTATLFTLHEHTGLIRGFSYADDQGGGYKDEWVQEGRLGTPVLQRSRTYVERAVSGAPSIWLPETETVFLNDAGTETAVTSFAYTWHGSTYQPATRTTTQPMVPSSQNGPGTFGVVVESYNTCGLRTGVTDQSGMVTAFEYDLVTGGMTKKTEDAGGLNLITDYQVDDQGRTVLEQGPVHAVDLAGSLTSVRTASWTYYRDHEEQRVTFPGYIIPGATADLDTRHCTGPVTVERGCMLPDSPDGTSFSATTVSPWELVRLPEPSDDFAQPGWIRWQARHFSKGGELIADRLYHLIPDSGEGAKDTNYAQTGYEYDAAGRVDRVTTPGGTVQKTVFNVLGWVMSRLTGTSPSNLLTAVENQYDGNADAGDGLLTKTTVLVDSTAGNNRVTDFIYDWRQRQKTASTAVTVDTGAATLITENTYDNRGLVTDVKQYRTSVAAGNLLDWSQTKFDVLGRPFQAIRYEVNPATGAVGNALTGNTWYDLEGRILVQWPSGSQAFQSMVYDAVGRVTAAYTAYQPGWTSGQPDIAQSIVMEQRDMDYDKAGNVLSTTLKQRYDNATGNGPLQDHGATQPQARVSYSASYPDAIGRTVATANYGTNGLLTWSRSPVIPTCTDDVLVNLTAYNQKGEPYLTTDPMQAQTTRTWDAAGRLTQEIQGRVPNRTVPAIDRQTNYEYNPDGNLTKLIARNNPAGGTGGLQNQETVWTYGVTTAGGSALNSNLLVATKTYPDSTGGSDIVTYTYNRAGQVTTMKDQAGLVHTYTFDTLGRQTQDEVTAWGASSADQTIKKLTTEYNDRGLAASAMSRDNTNAVRNAVYFDYNGWRQLASEVQVQNLPGIGGVTRTVQYGYESGASGSNTVRRTSMTYPSGAALQYHYSSTGTSHGNALSRVSSIRDGSTDIISYQYLGLGTPVDVNYNVPATHLSLGTSTDHYAGLDRFGRPITMAWLKGSAASVKAQYRYDRSSNRQWRYDAAAHAAGVTTEDQWYEYDGLYQVREFQRGTLGGTYPAFSGITPVSKNQDWTYDAMGNWLGFTSDALSQTRQFNKVNEITSIAGPSDVITPLYDPAGNMTTMPAADNWTTAQTITWDAWNRPVKVTQGGTTVASYTYDAQFRRISKTTGTTLRLFAYSDRWQILEEYVDLATTPQARYWYGIRDINDIARRQILGATSTDLYALRETMNVVALVNTSGTVTQRMSYDAFGNVRFLNGSTWAGSTNAADWSPLFHAHYRDAETGLYQMRFRYYHPNLGVWLSRDPYLTRHPGDSYKFTHNNTILKIDILGLYEDCCAGRAYEDTTHCCSAALRVVPKRDCTWRVVKAHGADQGDRGGMDDYFDERLANVQPGDRYGFSGCNRKRYNRKIKPWRRIDGANTEDAGPLLFNSEHPRLANGYDDLKNLWESAIKGAKRECGMGQTCCKTITIVVECPDVLKEVYTKDLVGEDGVYCGKEEKIVC